MQHNSLRSFQIETVASLFQAGNVEGARRAARKAGDGNVVAEFLRLQREAEERAAAERRRVYATPAPRADKTARQGGRAAALARKRAKAEADRELRAQMRGGNGGGKKR